MIPFSPAEIDQVKTSADVLSLAERYSTLRKIAATEYAGPCPSCSGTDRFHVNTKTQRWMCSNCTGREKWQDVIELWRHVTGDSFGAAVEALGGHHGATIVPIAPREPEPVKPPEWKTDEWQRRAWWLVNDSCTRLDSADGVPGREYLSSRGIELRTAYNWLLGYTLVSPNGGPSITMPYCRFDNDSVMAVRYRRIDPSEERFRFHKGSTASLCGLHLVNFNASTLVVVEGEFNAISIHQAGKDMDLTVISTGSESITKEARKGITWLSGQFKRCVVWCDKPEVAQQLRGLVTSPTVQMRRSPTIDGAKIDANDMLQRGMLADFLTRILTTEAEVIR